ncbi:hypothetical protein BDV59DRAFT_182607 [Aspergillus ambiguus]|uniref:uncharacterized protein n=1 Tax=Aspergillus ambiguus TaxID=176160 RepID=UPI003CCD98DF
MYDVIYGEGCLYGSRDIKKLIDTFHLIYHVWDAWSLYLITGCNYCCVFGVLLPSCSSNVRPYIFENDHIPQLWTRRCSDDHWHNSLRCTHWCQSCNS